QQGRRAPRARRLGAGGGRAPRARSRSLPQLDRYLRPRPRHHVLALGARRRPPGAAHARGPARGARVVSAGLLRGLVCGGSGAGAGLGRAIGLAFAREGAHLVLGGRPEATGQRIAAEAAAAGAAAHAVVVDVTRPEDRERLIAAAVDRHGGVDVLVNNAFA